MALTEVLVRLAWLLAAASASKAGPCLSQASLVNPDDASSVVTDVVIAGGRIAGVGDGLARTCVEGARIDARGLFVLPGFIDTHVHAIGNPSPTDRADEDMEVEEVARLALRAGVTTIVELGGVLPEARRHRLKFRADTAQVLSSGGILSRGSFSGRSDDEIQEILGTYTRRAPDLLKFIFDARHAEAVLKAAQRAGVKSIVHIDSWQGARQASGLGADAITHFEDEKLIPDDLPALLARNGTAVIPTMAVQCDMAALAAGADWLDDPLLAAVSGTSLRRQYPQQASYTKNARFWVRWQSQGCRPNDFPSLRRLHEANVVLMAGSDSGNLGTFQAFSLHREMQLMVEAGLPPSVALQAATSHPRRFFGLPRGMTTGSPADLVLLSASPLDDIRNTKAIAGVLRFGRWAVPLARR